MQPTPSAIPSSASVWEDFVDIFYAPRAVFERRREAGFGIPLLVLVLALGIVFAVAKPVLEPVFDAEFARASAKAIAENPQAAQQIEQGRAFFEKTQYFLVPFGTLLSVFVLSLVLWIVVRFFDLKLEFKAASVIATYSMFPRILEQILALVQGFLLSPESLTSRFSLSIGPARFLDPDTTSPILLGVLSRVDLFSIWVTLLLIFGIEIICRTSRSKAVIVGITMWTLGMLPALFSAIREMNS